MKGQIFWSDRNNTFIEIVSVSILGRKQVHVSTVFCSTSYPPECRCNGIPLAAASIFLAGMLSGFCYSRCFICINTHNFILNPFISSLAVYCTGAKFFIRFVVVLPKLHV